MTALPETQGLRRRAVVGPGPILRPAGLDDLDALVELENRCFTYDRLSRRSLRHFLTTDTAVCLVAERAGVPAGYVLVLFHGRTALARLYSMAVAPEHQGQLHLGMAISAGLLAFLRRAQGGADQVSETAGDRQQSGLAGGPVVSHRRLDQVPRAVELVS